MLPEMPDVGMLPEVPYDATAVRPGWPDLPADLRDAISDRLGAPVVSTRIAGAGFTRGFAAVLGTVTGERVFGKAAPLDTSLAGFYAREAAVTAALPPEVPVARLRWTLAAAGHLALCLDAVDGRVPGLPWSPADLDAALRAWAVSAAALHTPPDALLAVGLPQLGDLLRDELCCWAPVAAGELPTPPLPGWATGRLTDLVTLEQTSIGYAAGSAAMHGDLRLDNVLLEAGGGALLCDWTWPCRGAQFFDTVTLLVSAYGGGVDVDALLAAHPTADGVPAVAVDAVLAALAGYWLTRAADGPGDASPHSVGHHLFSGRQALAWLGARRGWA
jgi:hypothetical protein